MHRFIGLAVALTAASLARQANASDLSVCATGCPLATIQSAIDSSHDGDIIHIGPGVYFENLNIGNERLTLLGAGEDVTQINGRDRASVVTLGAVSAGPEKTVTIFGVTITHGNSKSDGGGIRVLGAVLDLENSIVASNQAAGDGGGISTDNSGSGPNKIIKSMIIHNRAGGLGGGIRAGAEVQTQIANSTISRNTAGLRGGALQAEGASSTTISGTTFSDNTSRQDGGALYLEGGEPRARLTVDGCSFVGNTAARNGGGIIALGHFDVSRTVVARNTAGGDGGGIWGGASLNDVFVIQNKAGGTGGGIFGTVTQTNSTVRDNQPNDQSSAAL